MKASAFLAEHAKSSQPIWESAAVDAAIKGSSMVPWPMVEVPLRVPDQLKGHTASVFVSSDVFALGERDDYMRMPLTPGNAQKIADSQSALLPTRKISQDIATASTARIEPMPQWPNQGPNLAQYAAYQKQVAKVLDTTGAKFGQLVSGTNKDIVIWKGMTPGKVGIFGWYKLNGSRIQPLYTAHDDHYADYSHGTRLVSNDMIVDGEHTTLEKVLQDPKLAPFVSDEGALPLASLRYPTSSPARPPPPSGPGTPVEQFAKVVLYALGLSALVTISRGYSST